MPVRLAVLSVVAVLAVACGDDDGAGPVADPTVVDAPADPVPVAGSGGPAPAAATADETYDEAYLDTRAGSFPALDDPVFIEGTAATWLDDDDIVMGIAEGDEALAFPVDQMAYHHVANTSLAGEPFAVTY